MRNRESVSISMPTRVFAVAAGALLLAAGAVQLRAQRSSASPAQLKRLEVAEPSGKIMSFRDGTGSTNVRLKGTRVAPRTTIGARVESKRGVSEIEIRRGDIKQLERARRYGQDFFTYVVWAVSVDGQASNLGEITFDDRRPQGVTVTTNLQTFWLMVTAEPDYAVLDPSPVVVAYSFNQDGGDDASVPIGGALFYFTHYTVYNNSPSTAPINIPNDLLQARKAVELAEKSGILAEPTPAGGVRTSEEKRVHDTLATARDFLSQAESVYVQDKSNSDVKQFSRTAVQVSENARALALGAVGGIFIAKLEGDLNALKAEAEKMRAEVARLNVENEPMRQQVAEFRSKNQEVSARLADAERELAGLQARVEELEAQLASEREALQLATARAEKAEASVQSTQGSMEAMQTDMGGEVETLRAQTASEIEALKVQNAEQAAALQSQMTSGMESLRTEKDAEIARLTSEHAVQKSGFETELAELGKLLSETQAGSELLRSERDAICGELRRQLSSLGQLNDQGGSMALTLASDILFDSGSFDLRPVARENLAKLAVLRLLLFPDADVRYEGHTDLVGDSAYNQWLSEQRALAVYRYFLEQASGVATDANERDRLELRMVRAERLLGMSFASAANDPAGRDRLLGGLDGAVVGRGERDPIVNTERDEQRNRRVVLHFPPSQGGSFTAACEAPAG